MADSIVCPHCGDSPKALFECRQQSCNHLWCPLCDVEMLCPDCGSKDPYVLAPEDCDKELIEEQIKQNEQKYNAENLYYEFDIDCGNCKKLLVKVPLYIQKKSLSWIPDILRMFERNLKEELTDVTCDCTHQQLTFEVNIPAELRNAHVTAQNEYLKAKKIKNAFFDILLKCDLLKHPLNLIPCQRLTQLLLLDAVLSFPCMSQIHTPEWLDWFEWHGLNKTSAVIETPETEDLPDYSLRIVIDK